MGHIVVIGGSEGSHEPLQRIIGALPVPCAAAIFIVIHIGAQRSILPFLLTRSGIPAEFARNGSLIEASHIYVAPPDRHMLLEDGLIRLSQGPKIHYTRPAVDPLFMSAAEDHGDQVMGIILSGGGEDGAWGLRAIAERNGISIVQRPTEAIKASMPGTALAADHPEALPIEEIVLRVRAFCSS